MRYFIEYLASLLPSPRVIHGRDGKNPYLSRWYFLGRPRMRDGSSPFDEHGNPKKNIVWSRLPFTLVLHRFHRSDDDLELHNHPWRWAVSLVLAGGYREERRDGNEVIRRWVLPGDLNVIRHDTFHRVDLLEDDAWTLFLTGPKTSSWGLLESGHGEVPGLEGVPRGEAGGPVVCERVGPEGPGLERAGGPLRLHERKCWPQFFREAAWDDAPLPEDEAIAEAHPTRSGKHETYAEAMRLVGARRSKAGLVTLVNWLLVRLREAEKSKDCVYNERDRCVALIARMAEELGYRVGLGEHPREDASWDHDWRTIVFVDLPAGQVSWHVHDSERSLFAAIGEYVGQWDGHSTEEKYRRVDLTPIVNERAEVAEAKLFNLKPEA